MRSGELRHLVTLQRAATTQSPTTGELTPSWSDLGQVWASVEPISGREFEYAKGFGATVSHKITIRYYAGLQVNDRVFWLRNGVNRLFTINAILNAEERNIYQTLYCTEAVIPVPVGGGPA